MIAAGAAMIGAGLGFMLDPLRTFLRGHYA
jgi:hypothetical protein